MWYIRKKINHVSKRPHQVYCGVGEGCIGWSHIIGRHHISSAISALMDADRRAIRPGRSLSVHVSLACGCCWLLWLCWWLGSDEGMMVGCWEWLCWQWGWVDADVQVIVYMLPGCISLVYCCWDHQWLCWQFVQCWGDVVMPLAVTVPTLGDLAMCKLTIIHHKIDISWWVVSAL